MIDTVIALVILFTVAGLARQVSAELRAKPRNAGRLALYSALLLGMLIIGSTVMSRLFV
jgi:hypothetical protein